MAVSAYAYLLRFSKYKRLRCCGAEDACSYHLNVHRLHNSLSIDNANHTEYSSYSNKSDGPHSANDAPNHRILYATRFANANSLVPFRTNRLHHSIAIKFVCYGGSNAYMECVEHNFEYMHRSDPCYTNSHKCSDEPRSENVHRSGAAGRNFY